MCLTLYKATCKPRVADKDIVCYKYLCKLLGYKKLFNTPYRNACVSMGETYTSEIEFGILLTENIDNKSYEGSAWVGEIEKGLHSYGNFKHAYQNANYSADRCVVKCVIPKGSTYYVGTFDSDVLSYASDKLTYVRKYSKLEAKIIMWFSRKSKELKISKFIN